jgi:diguanylate cyclase (GGDEF)-like protein
VAALFEPAPHNPECLEATASVGAELRGLTIDLDPEDTEGAAHAFTAAEETFVTRDTDDEPVSDRDFMRRARVRSVLWHPVLRDRQPVGLLAIGWREPVAGISLRLQSMIELLGAEAAVAIGRADMLGELERLARTDELTGLPNRRDWEERLPSELARAARGEQTLCVGMLDLDHFKEYNDRHGHQTGDRLLSDAAVAWLGVLRPYDVLARYGGEEFSLLLPDVDLDDAVALVERLRAATPDGESCSAGVAAWDGEEDAEALVGRADAALYEAKRAGRDRVSVAAHV